MKNAAFIYIITLLFITYGCNSSEENIKKNVLDSTKNRSMVDDTMPEVPIPPPAPAPGTAHIEAKIVSIQEPNINNELFVIQLKLLQVLGYGSSTPAVNVNDTLSVTASKLPKGFKVEKEFDLVIINEQIIGENKSGRYWRIVEVETN